MIDKIIAILKKHEQELSDGFDYYIPTWHNKYGDIENLDEFLRIVATEILEAVKSEMGKAGQRGPQTSG